MTHDNLCSTVLNSEMAEAFCNCDLIARVREDDQRILIKHGAEQFVRGEQIGKVMGYAAGVAAAREAVAAALEAGLATSSDKALYFFELDEDDPSCGHDVTFPKESLLSAIDAVVKR